MKPKNITAFLLASLILLSLATNSYGGFASVFTNNITFVKPFCKNNNLAITDTKSEIHQHKLDQQSQIPLICTSFLEFINPSFLLIYSEDNFENYNFKEFSQFNLFDERSYLPPRLS